MKSTKKKNAMGINSLKVQRVMFFLFHMKLPVVEVGNLPKGVSDVYNVIHKVRESLAGFGPFGRFMGLYNVSLWSNVQRSIWKMPRTMRCHLPLAY